MGSICFWRMSKDQKHKEQPKQILEIEDKLELNNQLKHFDENFEIKYKDALFQLPSFNLLNKKCKGIK